MTRPNRPRSSRRPWTRDEWRRARWWGKHVAEMSPEDLRVAEVSESWRPRGRGAPVTTEDGPGVVIGYAQRYSGRGPCWGAVVRLLDGRVRHYGINSMEPRERGEGEEKKMRDFEREARERRAVHDGSLDAAEVGRAIVRGAGRADVPLAAVAASAGGGVRRAVDDLLSGRVKSTDDIERYVAAACRAAVMGYASDARRRRRAAALALRAADAGPGAAALLTPEELDRVDVAACAAEIDGRRRWAETERDVWRRKAEELEARCAAMREAVEGRATPPTPEEREAMAASIDLDAYVEGRGVEEAREALFEDLRADGSPLALVDAGWDRRIRDRFAERHLGGPVRSPAWASAPWTRWVEYVYACRGLPAPDDVDPGRMPAFDARGRALPWWESVRYSYFSRPEGGRAAEIADVARTLWRRLGGVPVEAEMLPFPPDREQEQRRVVLGLRDGRVARMDPGLVAPVATPSVVLRRLTDPDELRLLWHTIPR